MIDNDHIQSLTQREGSVSEASDSGGSGAGKGVTIVIDLGKTLSKVSLWSRDGQMLDRQTRPNAPVMVDGLTRLDVKGIGEWLIGALARYAGHPVERIVPVGHGAGVVALRDGSVVVPPLDYEQPIPEALLAEYRAARDAFALTGSPALPAGLNFGSQLWWLHQRYPEQMADTTLLPWAQYWAWFLTGHAVSEVTSLGCHSDLWCPQAGDFAPMAKRLGWAKRFAPLARAGDTVGPITEAVSDATGLPCTIEVLAGLHDSNAALMAARGFAEIADHEATVLSTGTWFIAMRLPAQPVDTTSLPEARDCLVNVDVADRAVPSARFMGGREIETLIGIDTRRVDIKPDQPALLAAVPEALAERRMILPTLAPGCGPFPDGTFGWLNEPEDWYSRRAVACLYAALVADTALDLIGSKDRLLVEGRFTEAEVFVCALAALRPDTAVYTANAHNDVSFGALRLIDPALKPQGELTRVVPLEGDLEGYRAAWSNELEQRA
jgi:sugar (pentulose or hexulose) kinase